MLLEVEFSFIDRPITHHNLQRRQVLSICLSSVIEIRFKGRNWGAGWEHWRWIHLLHGVLEVLEHVQNFVIEGKLTVAFFFHFSVEISQHVGETAVTSGDSPDSLLHTQRSKPMPLLTELNYKV